MPLFKKREKFDRTDVPQESPHRNIIGAVVCLVVLAATALVVSTVWNRVKLESRLGDADLSSAVKSQKAVAASGGYALSEDAISCVLLLTESGETAEASASALQDVRILAMNTTQGTASLVRLPVQTAVTSQDATTTLSDLFVSGGYAACVAPLSAATQVKFDHVIVATDDVVADAVELAKLGKHDLIFAASGFLSKVRTDLDAAGLVELAQTMSGVGAANLTASDAVMYAQTTADAEGNVAETGYQLVDATQLGVALGLLVAPAAE